MEIRDYDVMSKKAYEIIKEAIETKDEPVTSLTTGGSPRGIFKLFVVTNAVNADASNIPFIYDFLCRRPNRTYCKKKKSSRDDS